MLDLKGIIPPIVTPFNSSEGLDKDRLRKEVQFVLAAGVHGISFGGSTGEGALLSDEEIFEGISVIKAENKKNIPLLSGIIRNSTRQAVTAARSAKSAGADVLMVTPTYYHGTNDKGNYAFYKSLSDEVGLPIVIYNVIKTNPILPDLMKKLSTIENVVGIKQSVGGIHSLTDMISICGKDTLVFGAQDDLLFASYLLGAKGAISAILTVFPKLCVEQWEAIEKGDIERAKQIHYAILPIWRKIEGGAFPGKIKATLNLLGRNVGNARSPILQPSKAELAQLENEIKILKEAEKEL